MVPQRRVFRVCALNLASDESLGYQHIGAMYHRGRILSVSTNESYDGTRSYRGMIRAVRELDCFTAHIHLREPDKSKDKAEWSKGARKRQRVQRGSVTQVQCVGQKGSGLGGVSQCCRGGATDCEKKDIDARQRIVGCGLGSTTVPQRREFHGVIDHLLSWRESVGHERGRGGGECRGKLQAPRQGRRAEAKELHRIGINGLLIKIVEMKDFELM
ncbi:hypothetical protein B296_00025229 [Ensete ventricosum]|uniref:Uncharacterized protein n=1 Tax=Ensete ventricosum TaxID=4639 RepID=A0A426YXH9_ENSVE|nr:hypothetical protein B296_00025229 [Ensete ventricosum]